MGGLARPRCRGVPTAPHPPTTDPHPPLVTLNEREINVEGWSIPRLVGWRVVTSEAGSPVVIIQVSPDDQQIITFAEHPQSAPPGTRQHRADHALGACVQLGARASLCVCHRPTLLCRNAPNAVG
ncbi:MAG UNVERIFIED_CONTAM: hypothetical protein LVT10_18335 [Anaerolineae bacterium]